MVTRATLLIAFLVATIAGAAPETSGDSKRDFEAFAAQLPYLSIDSVLYDRPDHHFKVSDPKKHELHFSLIKQVTNGSYPVPQLADLLAHPDARVRTLAAVALFDLEDPKQLPALRRLCEDESKTFDGYAPLSTVWLQHTGIGPPPQKQTVADVATKMLAFYMERAGFYYGVTHRSEPGFDAYWRARGSRKHCASWFAVQLARASHGILPTQKQCLPGIQAVRKRIDSLPAVHRTWILLWLRGESGSDALASDDELLALAKELGSEKLLLMLQHRIPNDDPDLQPRPRSNWPYKRMSLFVLSHAKQLLRPTDADALLGCEVWQRDYQKHGLTDPNISSAWAVAAARLQPHRATDILTAAMARFTGRYHSDDRALIAAAMWQLVGSEQSAFVVNWFYTNQPQHGTVPSQIKFIDALGRGAEAKPVIAQLIRDPRWPNIDWQSLARLAQVVNGWAPSPVLSDDEQRKARHPLGQSHYHSSRDVAQEKYPEETAELEARLAHWRDKLRESIPLWLPPEK